MSDTIDDIKDGSYFPELERARKFIRSYLLKRLTNENTIEDLSLEDKEAISVFYYVYHKGVYPRYASSFSHYINKEKNIEDKTSIPDYVLWAAAMSNMNMLGISGFVATETSLEYLKTSLREWYKNPFINSSPNYLKNAIPYNLIDSILCDRRGKPIGNLIPFIALLDTFSKHGMPHSLNTGLYQSTSPILMAIDSHVEKTFYKENIEYFRKTFNDTDIRIIIENKIEKMGPEAKKLIMPSQHGKGKRLNKELIKTISKLSLDIIKESNLYDLSQKYFAYYRKKDTRLIIDGATDIFKLYLNKYPNPFYYSDGRFNQALVANKDIKKITISNPLHIGDSGEAPFASTDLAATTLGSIYRHNLKEEIEHGLDDIKPNNDIDEINKFKKYFLYGMYSLTDNSSSIRGTIKEAIDNAKNEKEEDGKDGKDGKKGIVKSIAKKVAPIKFTIEKDPGFTSIYKLFTNLRFMYVLEASIEEIHGLLWCLLALLRYIEDGISIMSYFNHIKNEKTIEDIMRISKKFYLGAKYYYTDASKKIIREIDSDISRGFVSAFPAVISVIPKNEGIFNVFISGGYYTMSALDKPNIILNTCQNIRTALGSTPLLDEIIKIAKNESETLIKAETGLDIKLQSIESLLIKIERMISTKFRNDYIFNPIVNKNVTYKEMIYSCALHGEHLGSKVKTVQAHMFIRRNGKDRLYTAYNNITTDGIDLIPIIYESGGGNIQAVNMEEEKLVYIPGKEKYRKFDLYIHVEPERRDDVRGAFMYFSNK